jgi:GH24 family phage-related lysozyme (muramidase)/predicted chitinase
MSFLKNAECTKGAKCLSIYKDSAGIDTIGYGHACHVDPQGCAQFKGKTLTQPEAEQLLRTDMQKYADRVNKLVKVPLTPDQFSALVSFEYNTGGLHGKTESTLLKKLNAGDYNGAAEQFKEWNKQTVNGQKEEVKGLTTRRAAECSLFTGGSSICGGSAPHTNPAPKPVNPAPQPVPKPVNPAPQPAPKPVNPAPQPAPKPVNPAPQPAPKPVNPAPQPAPKPVNPAPQPAPKPVNPAPQPAPKPVNPAPQPAPKPVNPAPQPAPKPVNPAPQPAPKPVNPAPQPAPKPVNPAPQPAPKPVNPAPQPAPKPVNPAPQPAPKPVNPAPQPAPKPVNPAPQPAPKPVNPAPQPAPKPVDPAPQPAPKPVNPAPQPAPKPVNPAPQPAPKPVNPAPQPAPKPVNPAPQPNPAQTILKKEDFVSITKSHFTAGKPTETQLNYIMNNYKDAGITSKKELAMFIAQTMKESAGFSATKEICGKAGCSTKYDVGGEPGQHYYGRGYIQLTGPKNYMAASKAIFGDDRLYKNPDLVNNEDMNWKVSMWFWKENVHPSKAVQEGRFDGSTKRINSKTDTYEERFNIYKKVYKAMGIDGEPQN